MRLLSTVVQSLLVTLVRVYRAFSRRLLPPVCRFHPTCSAYALEALQVHGPWRGALLSAGRICRCHPFNPGGVDFVPPRSGPAGDQSSAGALPAPERARA